MQAKREWAITVIACQMHFQFQKTFTTACIIMSAEYHLTALCWSAGASNTFSMIASKVREGIPNGKVVSDTAFHGAHIHSFTNSWSRYFPVVIVPLLGAVFQTISQGQPVSYVSDTKFSEHQYHTKLSSS